MNVKWGKAMEKYKPVNVNWNHEIGLGHMSVLTASKFDKVTVLKF